MRIYIDKDYLCHQRGGEGRRPVELDFFEGKCSKFIEGYRYVPAGEQWTRADGAVFKGEMLCPAKNYGMLSAMQQVYEQFHPEISELREKLQRLQDCLDGLSGLPSLEQLTDCLFTMREILEDE